MRPESQPWNSVFRPKDFPDAVASIPTMLTREEQHLLAWLTENAVSGRGAVIDLGCFFGGSTARLAYGLKLGKTSAPIYAYDRFEIMEAQKEKLLYQYGVPKFEGTDMLPLSREALAKIGVPINFCKGDVTQQAWNGADIEILFVDINKTDIVNDHVAAEFYGSVVEGGYIVHQDYLHYQTPWLIAQMEILSECFKFVAATHVNTVLFQCIKRPTKDDIQAARTVGMADERMKALVLKAAKRFSMQRHQELTLDAWMALENTPGERIAWRMNLPQRDARRYEQLLGNM